MVLSCMQDIDWKIYSQAKIDKIKFGEDLVWSDKPLPFHVFSGLKPY
jgi:hypothetical protein